jgi:MAP/microtubule affinity-regulating kinase
MYDPHSSTIKIIDFGFACSSKDKLRVFCGTPSYMSPEIVSKRDYWGPAADVWACGVILFMMMTGNLPFKSQNEKDLFKKIQKGAYILAPPKPSNAASLIQQNKL